MKVLILGIDALDRELLDRFATQLPNFARLRKVAQTLDVISTFPPDSDTAWATIMTGLNPAQHGIVKFVDPLEKSYRILNKEEINTVLQGRTFWDIVSRAGFRACAVFPHLCYPVWETPAVMVSRGKLSNEVQATVPSVLDHYPSPDLLSGVRGLPDRDSNSMMEYFRKLSTLAEADAEFALRLYAQEDWDIFFAYWSTLDAIGHFFWNAFDESDPYFKANNPFRDVIPETYRLYDSILGRFLDRMRDDITLIVLSDHGHGKRPYIVVNVNEMLRQGGYLKTIDVRNKPYVLLLEGMKRAAIRNISKYGMAKLAGRIVRRIPQFVQAYTRPATINWDETLAYATDMSGIKAYTYGGVSINRKNLNGRDYEQVRTEIIELIRENGKDKTGQRLLKFIARREDVYRGPYLSLYPDIVLEFEYGYGVGWATNVPLISAADTYNLVPGSHRGETGTCVIRSSRGIVNNAVNLLDIVPSLLYLFEIPFPSKYDGKSIFD
jgi:predicted AlkP superfamily phosphohydrolase/phosphomutase